MFEVPAPIATDDTVTAFIERWQHTTGTEKANYQLFLSELCALLELPTPDPASKDNGENAYTFERRVDIQNPDGSENRGITTVGVQLSGMGFIVTPGEATKLGLGQNPDLYSVIRDYRNGRDLSQLPRGVKVIDLFGLEVEDVRNRFPDIYQRILERVKPERDQNPRESYRKKWWIFAEPRSEWRNMSKDLSRYIATIRTAKHRIFTFLDASILPDAKLVNIAINSPRVMDVLSSRLHTCWALVSGANLGVGNDPTYNHTRCFTTFPYPDVTDEQATHIGQLAEQIDAHRKRQQEEHPTLTLTGMYNVMEKLRAGSTLSDNEKIINQQGLVSTLLADHDALDRAVFNAYGWDDLAKELVGLPGATTPLPDKPAVQSEAEEELLMRLVTLNKQRAAEEAQGKVRWLRPDYQAPQETAPTQTEIASAATADATPVAEKTKATWPKDLASQVTQLRDMLAASPHSAESLATQFKRKPLKGITEVLSALAALGQAQQEGEQWRLVR
ncbi:hypothetical protein JNO04_11855 [Halomonas sp. MC140]|nr:hypothetical protein [Halomonas sp. MC140]MDN7133035.1 hypothetical protein [Halomonas sp. MC140]